MKKNGFYRKHRYNTQLMAKRYNHKIKKDTKNCKNCIFYHAGICEKLSEMQGKPSYVHSKENAVRCKYFTSKWIKEESQ